MSIDISNETKHNAKDIAKLLKGGWWNYRFVEIIQYGDVFYEPYEVYYNRDGKIISWTQDPVKLYCESRKDFEYLIKYLKRATKRTLLKFEGEGEDRKLIETGRKMNKWYTIDNSNTELK